MLKNLLQLLKLQEEQDKVTLPNANSNVTNQKGGQLGNKNAVNGPAVEKLMKRVNLNDNESMYYFHKTLDELGVSQRLKEMGIKDGDSVTIAGWELEWED